jgi:hypothetical protein
MKPKKKITAANLAELYEKALVLPKEPIGNKTCQLIQKKIGPRILPVCGGKCETGSCRLIVSVTGDRITIECRCQ